MKEILSREEEIIAVEQAWAKAHLNLDLDALKNILSDQYRQVQADGKVIGKGELLASYRSGLRK
jgi:hypothetical protein